MSGNRGLDAHLVLSREEGFVLDARLHAEPGHTIALLGPNGAGKSTTVRALCGLSPLESGRITLGERCLDDPRSGVWIPPEKRRIGTVFQDYALFPHLSVAENVSFGLRCRGEQPAAANARCRLWLERLGLAELARRRPADLSGGQAQRVALARALITEPELLLLDEPLAALDVTTRVELRRVLSSYLEQVSGPRLLITHDPTEAFLLADQILVIEAGAITQAGSADDIRLRPRTRYIADLAGSNLLRGNAAGGIVSVRGHALHIPDRAANGPVLATIHSRAVSLHRQRPEGSPRNSWQTRVSTAEHYGDRVRVQVEQPLPLVIEVTPDAVQELGLGRGTSVWVSIKATEIGVEPD